MSDIRRQTITVESTPLGEVIEIDFTEWKKQQLSERAKQYLNYYKQVYFKPSNGAYIHKFTNRLLKEQYPTGGDNKTSEYETETVFSPLTDRNSHDLQQYPDLYGCHYLGYMQQYTGMYQGVSGVEGEYFDSYTVTVEGETDHLKLEIIGPDDPIHDDESQIYFQYNSSSSTAMTFVYRATETAQTYTNIVGYTRVGSESGYESESEPIAYYDREFVFAKDFRLPDPTDMHGMKSTGKDDMPSQEYQTEKLYFQITSAAPCTLNAIKLYTNCKICLFSFAAARGKRVNSSETYSEYEFSVNTVSLDTAQKIKEGIIDDQMWNSLIEAKCKIPNGCISFKDENGEFKYLYPDINVFERAMNSSDDVKIPKSMVNYDTKTIPDDLLWLENCNDFNGIPISRLTHVAKLVCNDDNPIQINSFVKADSTYARFTDYWKVIGKYQEEENEYIECNQYKYKKSDETLPQTGGNMQFNPVFKPFAACSLVVVDKNAKDLIAKYPNFFIEPMKEHYLGIADSTNIDEIKKYYKEWTVDTNSDHDHNMKTLSNFAKTVSPFKAMVFSCKSYRIVFDESTQKSGRSLIDFSEDKCIGNAMLQKIADAENYWWSAGNFGENQKPSIGLFSCCSYSGGLQNVVTSASLGNCVPNDASKLITGMDNMFYVIGSTATHHNYRKGNELAELPFLCALKRKNYSYHDLCDKFNGMVNNLKDKVFKRIKEFYKDYYDDMISCLPTEKERLMWYMTRAMILDDLDNGGRRYFSIPYRSPDQKQGYDGYFHENENEYEVTLDSDDYLIHDGFVGLIRREVFEDDNENSKEYFIDIEQGDIDFDPNDPDNIAQHFIYDEQIYISNGLKKLKTDIEKISSLDKGYPAWLKRIALTEPVAKSTGAFQTSNQPFMANPNKDQDDWLTSDEELETLVQEEWKPM